MKKILCFILIGVISMGLSGCAEWIIKAGWHATTNVSKSEQKAMLKHLEDKYGEKFVIKKIYVPSNVSSFNRGATVYPEGRENEAFHVNLGTKGSRQCVDSYVLREPEKRMTPLYEEWIKSVIPSAKVAVKLSIDSQSKELFYNPNESIQQFVSQTDKISIDICIMLSEELLESKDFIFEKLSILPLTEPIFGYSDTEYKIGFILKDAFHSIQPGEYIYIPGYLKPLSEDDDVADAKNFIAISYFFSKSLEDTINIPSEVLRILEENLKIKDDDE